MRCSAPSTKPRSSLARCPAACAGRPPASATRPTSAASTSSSSGRGSHPSAVIAALKARAKAGTASGRRRGPDVGACRIPAPGPPLTPSTSAPGPHLDPCYNGVYDLERNPRLVPRLLRPERPPHRRQLPARAGQRPDAAVHQRGDEPVQGHVPRARAAGLPPGDQLAEVHAGQRQAQRPRERRAIAAAPHVLRDARQLLVWRLLQDRGDPLRVGTADGGLEAPARPAARDHLQPLGQRALVPARRRGVRDLAAVPASRADQRTRFDDNFWQMGDTGPCGRCSEVHYFRGNDLPCDQPVCLGVACECQRYVEIWNNVFMEFDRQADGTLNPLPAPSIDTGMGLERITAILQGVISNYDTDLFTPLLSAIGESRARGTTAGMSPTDVSMRVVADHARATAFLHRRRRGAVQQGPRLRAAQDHAARHAPRQAPGHRRAVPPPAGRRARRTRWARPTRSSAAPRLRGHG